MKQLFILIDVSGSIALGDSPKLGQINDTVRDMLVAANGKYTSAYVIIYSDMPRIYWQSSALAPFEDLTEYHMGGLSNLGKAYAFVEETMAANSTIPKDVCTVLLSDGEATDDCEKALLQLDPNNEMARIAVSLYPGYTEIIERHAIKREMIFTDIGSSSIRDELIDEVLLNLA